MRRFSFLFAVFVLCLAAAFLVQAQTTWYVDFQTAQFVPPGEHDGSEDKPFPEIGDAMDVAAAGDTVIVKPERYTENVQVVLGIELRAAQPANDEQTPAFEKTQIVPADDSLPAVLVSAAGTPIVPEQRTVIDGFQILEGAAEVGAGILVVEAPVRISRNELIFNEASGPEPFGGGVAIIGATFLDPEEFHAEIIDNAFVGNTAVNLFSGGFGGALACGLPEGTFVPETPRLLIADNQFIDPVGGFPNVAGFGGAVYVDQCEARIVSNEFVGNEAREDGGGLYCIDALCDLRAPAGATPNQFENNKADQSGGGVALVNPREGSRIVSTLFRGNVANAADDDFGEGGGIWVFSFVGDAAEVPIIGQAGASQPPPNSQSSLIEANQAFDGGGVAVAGAHGRVVLEGYHLLNNVAARHGGAVHVGPEAGLLLGLILIVDGPDPDFFIFGLGNLLADNRAGLAGGGMYVSGQSFVSAGGNLFGNLVPGTEDLLVPAQGNQVADAAGEATGPGGGAWLSDEAEEVLLLMNCFTDNESTIASGIFGGGENHKFIANSVYQNRAEDNEGGAVVLTGEADFTFAFNEVRENLRGGVTCQAEPEALNDNVIQGNGPFNLDQDNCGEGENNNTGAVAFVPGFPGATFFFPHCGPWGLNSGDYGDAPDNTGGAFPAGYRGEFANVAGRFPTYRESDHAGEGRVGPVHAFPPVFWLGPFTPQGGASVSNDRGAESPLDDDGVPNLDSTTLTPGQDGFKDGWQPRRLEPCSEETLDIEISADQQLLERLARLLQRTEPGNDPVAFLNIVTDWNHDGAWGGTEMLCADPAPEWAVQNLEVTLLPGDTVSVPATVQTGTTGDVWMRVSLSERPLDPPGGDWDGSAPAPGWLFGEVEDYLVCVGESDEACAEAEDQDRLFHDRFEAPD